MSSEELLVRNETFEDHHWELFEYLYTRYHDYFREKRGFTVGEAIHLCEIFAEHHHDTTVETWSQFERMLMRSIFRAYSMTYEMVILGDRLS